MSRKRKKNRDSMPSPKCKKGEFLGIPIGFDFVDLEDDVLAVRNRYECGGHPLLSDEELFEMSLARRLGKIVIPKHYDVAFTYTMRKPFADSEEEVKKFNKISEKFEKDVVDLLSKMMEFCSDIDMEVKSK